MKKKARLEFFEFYDTLGIEQHLESMAAKGWLLCDICGLYIYQRIIPQKIKFAVTYFCILGNFIFVAVIFKRYQYLQHDL